jgi:hypothetical protein
MIVSENTLKWAMRFYPPLFFQRIWIRRFHPGFKGVDVTIKPSLLNRNYNSSIFGGTIYSAADPFYAVLFDQVFRRKGYRTRVWLKAASIEYIRPGRSQLSFSLTLQEDEIERAKQALDIDGKYIAQHVIDIRDKSGVQCAAVKHEVYLRNLDFKKEQS